MKKFERQRRTSRVFCGYRGSIAKGSFGEQRWFYFVGPHDEWIV